MWREDEMIGYSHNEVIERSDGGKHGVISIFERKTGVDPWSIVEDQFNYEIACCLIDRRRCRKDRIFLKTVAVYNHK